MSQKDPIEELFRDNQNGLDERPRDLIWDRIEERLDEKPVVKKKNNWWKYGVAASIIIGLLFGVFTILNNQNTGLKKEKSTQIVLEDVQINQENASEILDKLEENQDAIVLNKKQESVPEIKKGEMDEIETHIKLPETPKETNDIPAMETVPAAPAPQINSAENQNLEAEISSVQLPQKMEAKQAKVLTYGNERRRGNMADSIQINYKIQTLSIPVKNFVINYDLISQNDSIAILENSNIAFPNQITLKSKNDSIQVIFTGKNSKRNSSESKEIQKFVNENKVNLKWQYFNK